MSDNRPIGLLDSGLGGLTVTKEVIRQLPNEDIIFIGDEARMPYGVKTKDEIINCTRQLVQYLVDQNVKVIIYACNTATANALPALRKEFSIPMIGVIEPGAISATQVTKTKHIGVIGTEATIKAKSYSTAINGLDSDIDVLGIAAQDFVTFVEKDAIDSKDAKESIARTLKPYKDSDYDTLVLGCTHFPMLRDQIQNYLPDVKLVDSGVATVTLTKKFLDDNDMLTDTKDSKIKLHATGNINEFKRLASRWLATDIDEISLVNVEN
ncbi:glutamate racemase [Companilactobacillus baiquanensis]|uniref:Glutamate racemase n=1 Tax=Companilactobacillus baiquanensis TaxID=2486005 RepID=A0ABW1UW70_9LACO|nr:glutamate racemase [Companilactobacillus baiquanensis]